MVASTSPQVLAKLEWPALLATLSSHAQTAEGQERLLALSPDRNGESVQERWAQVEPLKRLAQQGLLAPIGGIPPHGRILRAANLGQILDGESLAAVAVLLEGVQRVHQFAAGLAISCSTLAKVRGQTLPMPKLLGEIQQAITPSGELKDDASPELTRIRRQRAQSRRRIEEALTRLLHEGASDASGGLGPYLQDDFFTVRSERYVIPIRVDGRGRVAGKILDTSASGQTLFLEPPTIAPLNDQLLELEVEEKLEIARIFRELSARIEAEAPTLAGNYDALIALDQMTAEAAFAAKIGAGPVNLVSEAKLDLRDARHPLLTRPDGRGAVGSDIRLEASQHVLIISGPNAGGKTVVLKTVGLLHLMAKAGLLIPAEPDSQLYLFDRVWIELGDSQSLAANLSTFSGHLAGLMPILEGANRKDLVLLDELAVGTDPQTGAAIGTAILEQLASARVTGLVTTHFDALKGMALADQRFRNGSMEFSLGALRPTYRLILDVPGQSYGLEVAEQIGLPRSLLDRARELRHGTMSNLDQAVSQLMAARDEAREARSRAETDRVAAEAERLRWQQEVDLLREQRRKVSQQLADRYEGRLTDLRREYDDLVRSLRQGLKEQDAALGREKVASERRAAEQSLGGMAQVISELRQAGMADKLPGRPAAAVDLVPGAPVFVLPLKRAGRVVRTTGEGSVEVEVGIVKMRVSTHDLRLLSPGEAAEPTAKGRKSAPSPQPPIRPLSPKGPLADGSLSGQAAAPPIGLTLPHPGNTLDVRGRDVEDALKAMWQFLDAGLRRGEERLVIIHGHGDGVLKAAMRAALRGRPPYALRFRPGQEQEGGDGVTVIEFQG